MLWDKLGPACLQSSFAGKDLTDELSMSEQHMLAMKKADCMLGRMSKSAARGSKGSGSSPL